MSSLHALASPANQGSASVILPVLSIDGAISQRRDAVENARREAA